MYVLYTSTNIRVQYVYGKQTRICMHCVRDRNHTHTKNLLCQVLYNQKIRFLPKARARRPGRPAANIETLPCGEGLLPLAAVTEL